MTDVSLALSPHFLPPSLFDFFKPAKVSKPHSPPLSSSDVAQATFKCTEALRPLAPLFFRRLNLVSSNAPTFQARSKCRFVKSVVQSRAPMTQSTACDGDFCPDENENAGSACKWRVAFVLSESTYTMCLSVAIARYCLQRAATVFCSESYGALPAATVANRTGYQRLPDVGTWLPRATTRGTCLPGYHRKLFGVNQYDEPCLTLARSDAPLTRIDAALTRTAALLTHTDAALPRYGAPVPRQCRVTARRPRQFLLARGYGNGQSYLGLPAAVSLLGQGFNVSTRGILAATLTDTKVGGWFIPATVRSLTNVTSPNVESLSIYPTRWGGPGTDSLEVNITLLSVYSACDARNSINITDVLFDSGDGGSYLWAIACSPTPDVPNNYTPTISAVRVKYAGEINVNVESVGPPSVNAGGPAGFFGISMLWNLAYYAQSSVGNGMADQLLELAANSGNSEQGKLLVEAPLITTYFFRPFPKMAKTGLVGHPLPSSFTICIVGPLYFKLLNGLNSMIGDA
ncbi:hypothetical protein DFH06DRAFT_1134489 [Mycena polygramma]|nr:hypothetical protein DFH06DRAFT_1134489 [Mycena polygramma]